MGRVLTTSALLDARVRAKLLEMFPPVYPDLYCWQVTMAYGEHVDCAGDVTEARIIGQVVTDQAQVLALEIWGSTRRPDGSPWHITLAMEHDVPPKFAKNFDPEDVRSLSGTKPPVLKLRFVERRAVVMPPELLAV